MSLVFVTGAASGVGLLTARELIDDGHDVVIHARNPERLTGEVTEIVDKVRGVVYGDLDSVTGVETVAASANEYGAFDAVIHNAGSDNEQKTFAVNVVAPYVLSALMTRPKRIVTVSSVMHVMGRRRPYRTHLRLVLSTTRIRNCCDCIDDGPCSSLAGDHGA